MIIALTDQDFDNKTRGGNVVVLFYSGRSGIDPGGLLGPAVNHSYSDEVKFMMIDVDLYPEIARRHVVYSFPALLCLRNGVVKKLIQKVEDPQKVLEAAEENACYRCCITRSRSESRRKRGPGRH